MSNDLIRTNYRVELVALVFGKQTGYLLDEQLLGVVRQIRMPRHLTPELVREFIAREALELIDYDPELEEFRVEINYYDGALTGKQINELGADPLRTFLVPLPEINCIMKGE